MLAYGSGGFNAESVAGFLVLENPILEATGLSDSEMICEIIANFFSYQQVGQISDLFFGIYQYLNTILLVYFVSYEIYVFHWFLVNNRVFVVHIMLPGGVQSPWFLLKEEFSQETHSKGYVAEFI